MSKNTQGLNVSRYDQVGPERGAHQSALVQASRCGSALLLVEENESRANSTSVMVKRISVAAQAIEFTTFGPLDCDKHLTLSVCAGALQIEIVVDNHRVQHEGGEWRCACEVYPSLPTELVRTLHEDGSDAIDCEQILGNPTAVTLSCGRRDSDDALNTYTSPDRGIYLIAGAPAELRRPSRLPVRHPRNSMLVAVAQWQAHSCGQWLIGYSFLLEDDRHRFHRLCKDARRVDSATANA